MGVPFLAKASRLATAGSARAECPRLGLRHRRPIYACPGLFPNGRSGPWYGTSYCKGLEQTMSKRQKQTAFLKSLVLHGNMGNRVQLQERIDKAERDELCAWRALWLVSLLAFFSICGICYSAVLIPEFFQSSSHVAVNFFYGLGLASLVCAIAFLFSWLWCRGALNRLHEECRHLITAMLERGERASHSPLFPPAFEKTEEEFVQHEHGAPAAVTPAHGTYSQLFSFRKAS